MIMSGYLSVFLRPITAVNPIDFSGRHFKFKWMVPADMMECLMNEGSENLQQCQWTHGICDDTPTEWKI